MIVGSNPATERGQILEWVKEIYNGSKKFRMGQTILQWRKELKPEKRLKVVHSKVSTVKTGEYRV